MGSPVIYRPSTPDFMRNSKFFTSYSTEILETFFQDEQLLIQNQFRSDQLEIRPMLIELLQSFAKKHDYSLATLHLAVYILDIYMDSYILSDFVEHQKLIGLVCLLLATKSEDVEEAVPTIKDLLKIVDMSTDLGIDLRLKGELEPKKVSNAYRNFAAMYCKLEFLIFESLEFNTIRPTVVSFINVFQSIVVTSCDLDDNIEQKSLGVLRVIANEYLKEFLVLIIQDIEFFNKSPSKIAAAIIGATRKLLHIQHYWNDTLEHLTRYQIDELRPLMMSLIEKRSSAIYHQADDILVDSGFISPSSASETDEEIKNVHKKRKLNGTIIFCQGI